MSIITALSPNIGLADSFERLLMPGPVIEGHKKFEDTCSNCHQPLGDTEQNTLCLDCHKKINLDVKDKLGLHGQVNVSGNKCKTCHTDHKGRDAKIVLLDHQEFDHKGTDFLLKDSHKAVECNSCHLPDNKFREAKHECIGCHKLDDVHQGELGNDCTDCHKETAWTKVDFDHEKTKFKLKGKHVDTTCISCHITETYTDAPKECYSCHRINDIHNSRFGEDCADCHNEKKWDSIKFDHDKTDYPLIGGHQKADCNSCHKPNSTKKTPTMCISCHRADDIHSGRNSQKCKNCHTTKNWEAKFDHRHETDFDLVGQHKELGCATCHKGDVYKDELPSKCVACHQQDDVHQESQGKECINCHNETDWQQQILFDHDVTHFPLVGLHSSVSCEDCHTSANFKETKSTCISCHQDEDIHKKTLGSDCRQCHTPSSWSFWLFDHDEQTKYPLEGKHAGLVCDACHIKPVVADELKLSPECITCHKKDDIHSGRFGNDCDRCHDNESFENFIFKAQ